MAEKRMQSLTDEAPACEEHIIHGNFTEKLRDELPCDEILYDLAELYKIFGDTTRIKLLYLLFEEELCVCDMSEFLGVSVSAVSHQLRILKQAKLVKFRKEGKSVFYSLADEHVRLILAQGMEHICE